MCCGHLNTVTTVKHTQVTTGSSTVTLPQLWQQGGQRANVLTVSCRAGAQVLLVLRGSQPFFHSRPAQNHTHLAPTGMELTRNDTKPFEMTQNHVK